MIYYVYSKQTTSRPKEYNMDKRDILESIGAIIIGLAVGALVFSSTLYQLAMGIANWK